MVIYVVPVNPASHTLTEGQKTLSIYLGKPPLQTSVVGGGVYARYGRAYRAV
jgi:hypothetical protein